jgi:hypothetical protein
MDVFGFRGMGVTKQRGSTKIVEDMWDRYGEKRFEQWICTIYWDGLTMETPIFLESILRNGAKNRQFSAVLGHFWQLFFGLRAQSLLTQAGGHDRMTRRGRVAQR